MKPTIGRVVIFHPTQAVAHAAIIAHVDSDTCVNLAVFNSNGCSYDMTSVQLVAPGAAKPEFGAYAEWIPHQVQPAPQAKPDADITFLVSKKTADALERIIQKLDEKIAAED